MNFISFNSGIQWK